MNSKARLTDLARRMAESPVVEKVEKQFSEKQKSEKRKFTKQKSVKAKRTNIQKAESTIEVNPPHGTKGDFIKVSVTFPPEMYKLIAEEVMRRKMNKEKNAVDAAVIREAVFEKFCK